MLLSVIEKWFLLGRFMHFCFSFGELVINCLKFLNAQHIYLFGLNEIVYGDLKL